MITEYFPSESSMNAWITYHGITRHQVSFMGQASDNRWQLSYWKTC
jgi:hypothetical protein